MSIWSRSLGADVVIDYKTQDFEKVLSGYDLVLNSQDAKTLEKSLGVLKPGGHLISISGPPDPAFAKELGLNLFLKLIMRLLSRGVRKKPKNLASVTRSCSCVPRASNWVKITSLIEAGVIRPVVDKVFPFEGIGDALAYVETGRAKGKVVITVAD